MSPTSYQLLYPALLGWQISQALLKKKAIREKIFNIIFNTLIMNTIIFESIKLQG
jgi:hypothetical protein